MKEEISNWWGQVLDDLDSAQANFSIKKYHIASLFSQQAVEKSLKAYYMQKYGGLKRTHDLVY